MEQNVQRTNMHVFSKHGVNKQVLLFTDDVLCHICHMFNKWESFLLSLLFNAHKLRSSPMKYCSVVWLAAQASLLCSLERELRGHLIAESVCTDGLLTDEGTQTYSFLSAPFRRNTSLADLTAVKPLELHLQLQVESVTSRHHKASSAFTFLCGHTFQRREYGKHYKWVVFLKYLGFALFKEIKTWTRNTQSSHWLRMML